jgi:hypothetical protein
MLFSSGKCLTTASPSKQDGEKLLQGGDICILYIPFDAALLGYDKLNKNLFFRTDTYTWFL